MKSELIIFFILVIVIIAFIAGFNFIKNDKLDNDSIKEGFLSGFRQMYRPYIRKARLYTTTKYNSLSGKMAVLLRKWGLW